MEWDGTTTRMEWNGTTTRMEWGGTLDRTSVDTYLGSGQEPLSLSSLTNFLSTSSHLWRRAFSASWEVVSGERGKKEREREGRGGRGEREGKERGKERGKEMVKEEREKRGGRRGGRVERREGGE